jgi:Xaa-Pro aminopeptidase
MLTQPCKTSSPAATSSCALLAPLVVSPLSTPTNGTPAPPPPPPPLCFPFGGPKKPRRLSDANSFDDKDSYSRHPSGGGQLVRSGSYSQSATLTSHAENLTFVSDSEQYDAIPLHGDRRPKLIRSHSTKLPTSKWGYGWGLGKNTLKGKDIIEESESLRSASKPPSVHTPSRHNSKSSHNYKASNNSKATQNSRTSNNSKATQNSRISHDSKASGNSKSTIKPVHIRSDSQRSKRPALYPSDSSSTLVGSALERKIHDAAVPFEKVDSTERLEELRKLMAKETLDY